MKAEQWQGWGIFTNAGMVVFDARCPVYWKRYIAKTAALEHGLGGAKIRKVRMSLSDKSAYKVTD